MEQNKDQSGAAVRGEAVAGHEAHFARLTGRNSLEGIATATQLDSQPSDLKQSLKSSPDPKYWAREFCKRNPACQEATVASWFEMAFSSAVALSSQPTDGGVRNG